MPHSTPRRLVLAPVALCVLAAGTTAQRFLTSLRASTSTTAISSIFPFDQDGDGDSDLFVATFPPQQDALLHNDGLGYFTEAQSLLPANAGWTRDVVAADFDRDGRVDLVLAKGADARYYRATANGLVDASAGALPPLGNYPATVVAGDFDRDSDLDLFVGGNPSAFLWNDGTGHFTAQSGFPICSNTAKAADLDGDGDLDLVTDTITTTSTFGVAIYTNGGTLGFTWRLLGFGGDWVDDLALGDLDGDGDADLAVLTQGVSVGTLRLRANDGLGNFSAPWPAPPQPFHRPYDLRIADLDGDRRSDLVCSGMDNGSLATVTMRNLGAGAFALAGQRFTDDQAARVADLDDDGDLDLVAFRYPATPSLLLNLHRHLDGPDLARLGQPWSLDFYDQPGYATTWSIAVPVIATGTRRTVLPGIGVVHLDPLSWIQLPPVFLTQGIPQRLTLTVPNDPMLVGSPAFAQAGVVTPFGALRLTNAVRTSLVR